MMRLRGLVLVGAASLLPVVAMGQRGTRPRPDTTRRDTVTRTIPKAALPPRGMCRIWMDGVPLARQPAPTDCATAVRNRPPNARVIFPDDTAATRGTPARPKPPPPGPDTSAGRRRKPPA